MAVTSTRKINRGAPAGDTPIADGRHNQPGRAEGMDIEHAQQLMASAVKATLECGQYPAAKTIATKTLVAGKSENVTCLIFGRSEDVLDVIARRVNGTTISEQVDSPNATAMTPEQREQLDLISRSNPAFILMHLRERTNYDAALVEKMFELAKERARDLLATHPQ